MRKSIMLTAAVCLVAVAAAAWWRLPRGHFSVIDLWLTPDQQGRYDFERGDFRSAAEQFQDPLWKGIASYRSGDLEAAATQFARVDTAAGYFNLGDAYAHLGQLEQAAARFQEALRLRPDGREIQENLELVQALIVKKGKKKEEEPPEGEEPNLKPDEVKFDEQGKKGKAGQVDRVPLSDDQIRDLWMRRLQTTPSGFLRLKFAIQAQTAGESKPQGASSD
jgi:Ca-activated chloride channel homolog